MPKKPEDIAEAIFEAIADPLFVIDFVDDGLAKTFRYVNESACRLLGRSRSELLLLRPGTVDEVDESVMEAAYLRLMAVGRTTFETLMIAADGTRIPVEIHASDALFEGQRVCIAVARSLVARKELDARTQEAKEAAETANRIKSEFLATMSHEIRTPLHGVIGFASLLDDADLPEPLREAAEGIRDSANLLLALVTDVLDFSRIEAGQLELQPAPLDLTQQLKRIAASFRLSAEEKGLAFHYREASLPPLVLADFLRIEQVLGNLLGNALKFTECGSITLEVLPASLPGSEDREIFFAVTDTGTGIRETEISRLFQPFSQVDASLSRRHGGSGLGLVIVKRLCELMGGNVTVRSEFGTGSVFTAVIRVPVLGNFVPVPDPGDRPNAPTASPRALRILVAEDNALNRKLMRRMFARLGYSAEFARNGHEVVEIAVSASYDLIFMDVSMPGISGLDATRAIRSHEQAAGHRPSRIVALTAGVSEEERKACAEAGMVDFLGKPFTEDRLRTTIHKAHECLSADLPDADLEGRTVWAPPIIYSLSGYFFLSSSIKK